MNRSTQSQTGWQQTTLGEVVKIGRGSSPRPIQEYLSPSGIPWVKIADATSSNTRFIHKTKEYIKETGRSTSVNIGDLIVSNSATPGIPKFMAIDACVHDGWLVFNEYKDLEKKYLYYFFLDYRKRLEHSASGTVFKNLTTDIVKDIELLLPPLPTQRAIAAVLSSLDDKIELLREQNKTLEATAQAIFKEWFVKKVDERWNTVRLGDVLESIECGTRPKGGIDPNLKHGLPSVGAENINGLGFYDYSKTKYITKDFFSNMKRGIIRDYDVLIYKDGAYVGRKSMFGKGFPFDKCSVNEHVFILRGNDKINQFFLYFLLQEDEMASLNANSAQPGLNQEAMRSFQIIMPPNDLIYKFGVFAKAYVDKIFSNCIQIQTLSTLRDTLLPKLMRGEVEVK